MLPFCIYISNELSEREIKQSHLQLHQKRIKYLGINLIKEVKELYSENYKTLMSEIEYKHRSNTVLMDWKN